MSKAAEVDKLLEQHMRGGLSRRQFMMRAGALGLSLPAIGGLLAACTQAAEAPTATSVPAAATAVAATATPARGLRRFEGMPKPIAATEEERSAWWLNEMRSSKMTLDDVALSPEEEAEIKSMGLKVGATWISYASKKHFYRALTVERRCKELGIELISHNNEMSDARRLTTARIFIDEKVDAVIGNDGHGEAVKAYNEAGIPVFSQGNPFRGYYPTIATVGMNRYAAGEEQAGILASKLAAEGYTDATIAILDAPPTISWVWHMQAQGFQLEAEKQPDQIINGVKMKMVKIQVPMREGKAAVEKVIQDYPDLHGLMTHGAFYADAAATLKELNRKDIWVVTFGLFEPHAASLLSGDWPLLHTFGTIPYPTLCVGMVNAMAKWFLGHDLPRWIVDPGVSVDSSNIEESWRAVYGGTWDAEPPWIQAKAWTPFLEGAGVTAASSTEETPWGA